MHSIYFFSNFIRPLPCTLPHTHFFSHTQTIVSFIFGFYFGVDPSHIFASIARNYSNIQQYYFINIGCVYVCVSCSPFFPLALALALSVLLHVEGKLEKS